MAGDTASRALQGIGGGAVIAVAQAERGRYQICFSGVHVAGPVLGGLLTEYLSWHWIFWLNFPLDLLALIVSWRALARIPLPQVKIDIDYAGALLLTGALLAVLTAITRIGMGAPASRSLRHHLPAQRGQRGQLLRCRAVPARPAPPSDINFGDIPIRNFSASKLPPFQRYGSCRLVSSVPPGTADQ